MSILNLIKKLPSILQQSSSFSILSIAGDQDRWGKNLLLDLEKSILYH
jgi:hypothetical protein